MWSPVEIQQTVVQAVDCIVRHDLSALRALCASMPTTCLQQVLHSRYKFGSPIEHAGRSEDYDILTYLAEIDESLNDAFLWGTWGYYFAEHPLRALRLFVQLGLDINAVDKKGNTLLGYITSNLSDFDQMRYLVELGADINNVHQEGYSALRMVLSNPSSTLLAERVNLTLDCGSALHEKSLIQAVRYPDTSILQILLDRGVDVNANNGETLLHGTMLGTVHTLNCLKRRGANLDIPELKEQALLIAVLRGVSSLIEFWVAQGAKVSHKVSWLPESISNYPLGQSALFVAVTSTNEEAIELLLEQDSLDIEERNTKARTLLMAACKHVDAHIVSLLLDRGADVNATDESGLTAAMLVFSPRPSYATDEGQISVLQALLDKGADFSLADKNGCTVAHHAAQFADVHCLLYLSALPSVDFSACDSCGNTCLHHIAKYGPATMFSRYDQLAGVPTRDTLSGSLIAGIDLIASLGVSVLQVNQMNETPLDVCDKTQYEVVAEHLQKMMANEGHRQ